MENYINHARLPYIERLSVPKSGRTLLNNVRTLGERLLASHNALNDVLKRTFNSDECISLYKENYSFINYSQSLNEEIIENLCSSALLLNWITGRISGYLTEEATLLDAERFYNGNGNKTTFSKEIRPHLQNEILAPIRHLSYDLQFLDIIPYATEVFETSEEVLTAFGSSRKKKRASGIFYTPSDVADNIVKQALCFANKKGLVTNNLKWLDPACGTGCFLLSIVYHAMENYGISNGNDILEYIENKIFGIDTSLIALQSAAYILVAISCLNCKDNDFYLKHSLLKVGKNLLSYDATAIKNRSELSKLLPTLGTADIIVSNPPYVNGTNGNYKNLYLNFIEMLPALTNQETGVGAMVVPLSVAFNSHKDFECVRREIWARNKWWLAHFDRTPDSLFGDDVKTRNTIVFFAHQERRELKTTKLVRWSSRARKKLFDSLIYTEVPAMFKNSNIPKIGSDLEKDLLNTLYSRKNEPLGKVLRACRNNKLYDDSLLVINNKVAYNWLPFERFSGASSGRQHWYANSPDDASMIFALLHSRLTYWLWRVWGDGFHLTNQFIVSIPLSPGCFSNKSKILLKQLGNKLWGEMLHKPISTKNAGVTNISYCPYFEETINYIDQILIDEYCLPSETLSFLKDYIHQVIVAGREDEINTNPALRRWAKRERKANECSVV